MRKIKGFKLVLRPHEVKRRAKKAGVDLEAAGLPDPVLNVFLEDAAKTVSPGVLFDTYGHPDPDQPLLSPLPGLAYSLILASIGDAFPQAPAPLKPVLQDVALEECVRFAAGLIADEAEKDNCELSPTTTPTGGPALEALVRKLDGAKLGVSIVDGRLTPPTTLAVSLSWLAKSKTKGRK